MFDIVLFQPEIPPNTGNVIRLAANMGGHLHLIKPLGFDFSDKQLRRAGLDYHDLTRVTLHENWSCCQSFFAGRRMYAFSTKGQHYYHQASYQPEDVLMFGCETRGLPDDIRQSFDAWHLLKLPMQPSNRSLNLSNSVAIVVYEAWRQNGFLHGI